MYTTLSWGGAGTRNIRYHESCISSPCTHTPSKRRTKNDHIPSELTGDWKQEIKEAFELFDIGKDGCEDFCALTVAIRRLDFDLKKAEVLKILRDHHKIGHGLIEIEAFKN